MIPAFSHIIWFKTRLGMQHLHLELLWILSYAITKKNKHISRINISDNKKIVINSPEVQTLALKTTCRSWVQKCN
jgi:hypothetical protein